MVEQGSDSVRAVLQENLSVCSLREGVRRWGWEGLS